MDDRRVLDAAPVGIAIAAPDGRILHANPALGRLLGLPLADRRLTDLVHPDDRDALAAAIALAGDDGSPAVEHRGLHADGHVVHVRCRVGLAGPERLIVTFDDVSAERALRLSGLRYRALVDNLADTIIGLYDGDLRLQLVEGGRGRPGLVPGDFEGRLLADIIGEGFAAIEPHLRAALAGEHRSFDFALAGSAWWVQVVPLRDDAQRVLGGVAVWRDVTGRKHAELQLSQRAMELERSNAELEQFAYIASHDLSEPLRMITSYLQLLERRYAPQLDDDARDFIHYAVDGSARMRALIDDLLAYSRVGRGDRDEEVDLQALVGDVVTTLTAAREDAGTVRVGKLPVVRGDAQALGQLFQNLIGNGLKFVPPERHAEVEVEAEPLRGGGWRFVVADNGIGIEPGQAERVFGVFQRLHGRDEYPGTGVGLAIARKVVERHGGRIWIEPRPGGGSRFCFELPRRRR